MDQVVTATEARVHFGELMQRVAAGGDPVIVERNGQPQVVVMAVAHYERLRAGNAEAPTWRALLQRAHALARSGQESGQPPAAEDVIRQMREERDADLLGLR